MAKRGRPRAEVVLSDEERRTLVRLTKRSRVEPGARVPSADRTGLCRGVGYGGGAAPSHDQDDSGQWRSQFVARRLAGLCDEPRVGAPRTITDEADEAIIVKTLETTPAAETHWSTRSMAKAAGVRHTMVGRIWRTFRLQPHRTESFKLSPDPQLIEKIRDVAGST